MAWYDVFPATLRVRLRGPWTIENNFEVLLAHWNLDAASVYAGTVSPTEGLCAEVCVCTCRLARAASY